MVLSGSMVGGKRAATLRGPTQNENPQEKTMSEHLTFEQLRKASYERATSAFGHEEGLTDWSPAGWSNAMAGEAGETCNLTKKILRDGLDSVDPEDLGDEIADVVVYADLLATRMGFRLEDLVRRKFNKVSVRKDTVIRL
jgi:NTP pyrophosphatase (non-canonical NTP hydrolase)